MDSLFQKREKSILYRESSQRRESSSQRRESSSQGSTSAADSFNWSLKPRELPEERGRREERLGAGREQSRKEGQRKGIQESVEVVGRTSPLVNMVVTIDQPSPDRSLVRVMMAADTDLVTGLGMCLTPSLWQCS